MRLKNINYKGDNNMKEYNNLKLMLNGNWKYSEKQNNEGNYLVLTNAGDIIAIYKENNELEIYYKANFSDYTNIYVRQTAEATFELINELF